jgi:predicted transposase/invertase (TIGR01784 family)
MNEDELEVQFKRRDFIWLQKGSLEKARKDGLKEGKEEGLKEGREKGEQEAKLSIARNLLAQNIDPEIIASGTGLSKELIIRLREQE